MGAVGGRPCEKDTGKGRYQATVMHRNEEKTNRKQRARNGRRIRVLVVCFAVLALFAVGGWIYVDGLAYKTVHVEAGIEVSASDLLKKADSGAVFTQDSQPFDIAVPGEYQVKVKSGLFTHSCRLIIQDTIPPTAQAVPVKREAGEAFGAEAFVSDITDATKVTVSYVTEPDFSRTGEQEVQVILTDRGGNWTVVDSKLYLIRLAEGVTMEAGGEMPDIDRFVEAGRNAVFLTQMSEIDSHKVGDHEVLLDIDGEVYSSMLHVEDTVPPLLEVHDVESFLQVPRKAEDFVSSSEDATELVFAFRQEPDLSLAGSQEVEIVARDGGGNETVKQARLTLREDTEAPVIHGAVDLDFFLGESISYRKNVTVADNCQEGVTLEVDTSGADLSREGVYPITYTATDVAGNRSSVTVNLTVRARLYTLEEMNAYADAVLEEIIEPDMSLRDKAWAIYSYVLGNVSYISHSEKGDWIRAAYEGLVDKKGDCYVYACTAKALLTRAGIPNLDIRRIPTSFEHYWNLVDVGEGWYHFDTTPRPDHPTIFLWTDAELMEYNAEHYDAFNYDPALYPEIN